MGWAAWAAGQLGKSIMRSLLCAFFVLSVPLWFSLTFNYYLRKMKAYLLFPSLICIFHLTSIGAYGQGCSDAGLCTINNFSPSAGDTTLSFKNRMKVGMTYGAADHSITAIGNYLEFRRNFNNQFGMDIKITSLAQNGNNISAFGLSDVYLNANYQLCENMGITAGVKFPLNAANKTKDGLPLPMDYQSSLGTIDLIAGVAYKIKHFGLVAAIQQPLTQNENEFLSELYPENSKLRMFQSTNQFERSGDVLLRAYYQLTINNKFKITPGILPIYHLSNDKFTDMKGMKQEIDGSQGLTFNGNLFLDYKLTSQGILQISFSAPFVVRDERPDGLTRSYVVGIEYGLWF
jgi:hypothetical protein